VSGLDTNNDFSVHEVEIDEPETGELTIAHAGHEQRVPYIPPTRWAGVQAFPFLGGTCVIVRK
jgi:hypothetical protein